MPTCIFTYGSLQKEEVQLQLFQRKLQGEQDILEGYQMSNEKLYGQYPVIIKTDNKLHNISGMRYTIHPEEIKAMDRYEGILYKREQVSLQSGIQAWVYTKNSI